MPSSNVTLARFAGLAAATVAVVCGLGIWPTIQIAGSSALVAVAGAAALSFVAAILGFLPSRALGRSAESRAQAWMIGLGVRMFFTLAALVVAWVARVPYRETLAVWTAVLYLALLLLETVVVARSAHLADRPGTSA